MLLYIFTLLIPVLLYSVRVEVEGNRLLTPWARHLESVMYEGRFSRHLPVVETGLDRLIALVEAAIQTGTASGD